MIALLICNGDIIDYDITKNRLWEYDIIIVCDGGLRHVHKLGVVPNYIIGDFDSVDSNLLEQYKNSDTIIETFDIDKDYTDTELGLKKAIELDCEDVHIIGGIGSRLDHTIANIMLIKQGIESDVNIALINEYNIVNMLVDESCINIKNKVGYNCSIIPITRKIVGVTTVGLKYQLNDDVLYMNATKGISNVIESNDCSIVMKKGECLVIVSND